MKVLLSIAQLNIPPALPLRGHLLLFLSAEPSWSVHRNEQGDSSSWVYESQPNGQSRQAVLRWRQESYCFIKREVQRLRLSAQQARMVAYSDQVRCSNTTCLVLSGDLLSIDSRSWEACAATAHAPPSRHRNMINLQKISWQWSSSPNWVITLGDRKTKLKLHSFVGIGLRKGALLAELISITYCVLP